MLQSSSLTFNAFYTNKSNKKDYFSTDYKVDIEQYQFSEPTVKDKATTILAKSILEHFEIVASSRDLIKKGKTLNFNAYSRSR